MGILLSIILNLSSVDISKTLDTVKYELMIFDNKTSDVYQVSGLNDKEIDKLLQGTFLEGEGKLMMYIEQEYHINFRAIFAISALESGRGKYAYNNNYCGLRTGVNGSYGGFNSRYDCLVYLTDLLNNPVYRGKNLEQIGAIYAPIDDSCETNKYWAYNVRKIMLEI